MSNDFSKLRKSSAKSLAKLQENIEKATSTKSYVDERYWSPTKDKSGNATALIRFMPAPVGEEEEFIRYWDHVFKGPTGQWYIERSLTSINQPDPLGEHNQKLWATGDENNQNIVRSRRRNLRYVANIYVVKDPGNPENEGKVFLYRFGKKIFDKIEACAAPDELDESKELFNPFDLWGGANFRLKVKSVKADGGRSFTSYDDSSFDRPAPLFKEDDAMEAIWKQCHSLAAENAPDKYKSYDELKKRVQAVLGLDEDVTAADVGAASDADLSESDEDLYKKLVSA